MLLKKIKLTITAMNIDGLIFLSPWLVVGPQKPQTLTASKPKYENFGPKIQIPH